MAGARQIVSTTREIILAAGTVGTPHILLNSGIGNSSELQEVGVKTVIHLPDVGKHLSDHPRLVSNWLVRNDSHTFDIINRNSTVVTELLQQWQNTQTGPLVDTFASQISFHRLPTDSPIFQVVDDPAAGPHTPHFELGFSVSVAIFDLSFVLKRRSRMASLGWCRSLAIISGSPPGSSVRPPVSQF